LILRLLQMLFVSFPHPGRHGILMDPFFDPDPTKRFAL